MDNVLVTGGRGFVGRYLLQQLSEMSVQVSTLSRSDDATPYTTFVCDLQCDQIPIDAFSGIDTVFHLAGVAHDSRNAKELEDLYYSVNVDATERLARAAVDHGVKRFVFISSVKAGGSPVSGRCVDELDQAKPEGVYGATKREAELRLLEISRESGMHISIIRPALVYGQGIKGNLRKMLLAVERGWFPSLPETNNRRSMIHVKDLVKAILLVALDKRADGEIYIATDQISYSSKKIYGAMREGLGMSAIRWEVPNFIFKLFARIGDLLGNWFPFNSYTYQKLLGDECYQSEKLHSLGFLPVYSFYETVREMVPPSDEGSDSVIC